MKWVSRSDWGARYGRGPTNITPERGGVAIHWEGPRMGTFPHSSCDDKVRGIERFHVESNGWSGIAYTLLVCPHGYVFEGRGVGHRTAANGSNDGNQRFYAVCALLGKGDPHPPALFAGLADAVAYLRGKDAGNDLKPHSAFFATECPGDKLRDWIKDGAPRPATDEEEDPMPEYVHVTGEAKNVPPGRWHTVTVTSSGWKKSYAHVLDGPARIHGYARVQCEAPAGTEVQVRVVETEDGGSRVLEDHPWGEGVAAGGGTPVFVPVLGDLQDKRDLRVQVKHWRDDGAAVDMHVTARLHHWPT